LLAGAKGFEKKKPSDARHDSAAQLSEKSINMAKNRGRPGVSLAITNTP